MVAVPGGEHVEAPVAVVAVFTQQRDDIDDPAERRQVDLPPQSGSSVGSMISKSSTAGGSSGPSVATGMSRLSTVNERPSRTSRR